MAEGNAKKSIESGLYQQHLAEKQLANKSGNSGGAQDFDDDGSKGDKRDERRKKAASGKAGGGSQGRETKTKSTKKHQRGKGAAQFDSDDDESNVKGGTSKKTQKSLELVKLSEIVSNINKKLEEEGLEHLAANIAGLYHG